MDELNESLNEINSILESIPGSSVPAFDVALALFSIIIILFIVGFILLFKIIGKWMLFTKAGQSGWKVLIPFYGLYVYITQICKCSWVVYLLRLFLFWLPPINMIVNAMICYNLAIKTHQSPTSYVWFSLFSVPVEVILGFCRKSYEYNADEPSSSFGFFGEKN